MPPNYRLLYSIEALISKANPNNEIFGQSAFYKLLFLLYKKLQTCEIDIKLPYSWYRFGVLPDNASINSSTTRPLYHYAPRLSFSQTLSPPTIFIECPADYPLLQTEKEVILEEIENLLSQFSPKDYLNIQIPEKIIEESYKFRPTNFHFVLNRFFRPYLEMIENEQEKLFEFDVEGLQHMLDILMKEYPKSEMQELFPEYLRWDDTIRLAIELENDEMIFKLNRDFRNIFSYLSREKYNENIQPDVISRWERDFKDTWLQVYQQTLEFDRNILFNSYEMISDNIDIKNAVIKAMSISKEFALK